MAIAVKSLVGEWWRFFTVNIVGLVVDLSVAVVLRFFGVNLFIAASLSFTIAALLNFQLHNRWTFQARTNGSAERLAAYYLSALTTITVRLVLLKALMLFNFPSLVNPDLEMLILATCGSLIVNFLFCKFLIFKA